MAQLLKTVLCDNLKTAVKRHSNIVCRYRATKYRKWIFKNEKIRFYEYAAYIGPFDLLIKFGQFTMETNSLLKFKQSDD